MFSVGKVSAFFQQKARNGLIVRFFFQFQPCKVLTVSAHFSGYAISKIWKNETNNHLTYFSKSFSFVFHLQQRAQKKQKQKTVLD